MEKAFQNVHELLAGILNLEEVSNLAIYEDLFGSCPQRMTDFLLNNNFDSLAVRPEITAEEYKPVSEKLYSLYLKRYSALGVSDIQAKGKFGTVWKDYTEKVKNRNKNIFFKTFERRLISDHQLIRSFSGFDPDYITDIEFHGDPHDVGKRVIELTDINHKRIFYKPRSLEGFSILSKIFRIINFHLGYNLICPASLISDGYGWLEALDFEISSMDTNKEFAEAYGALIAVAQFTGLSDLHSENYRWTSKGLAVIDIDVMFRSIESDDVDEIAGYCMPQSTGLVPYVDVIDRSQSCLLFSKLPTVDIISAAYLNTMRLLVGSTKIIEYVYSRMSRIICRYIPRNTATYSQLSQILTGDAFSNNAVYFIRVLSNLYPAVSKKPHLKSVVRQEVEQLLNLDIPAFYRDVVTGAPTNFTAQPLLSGKEFFSYKLEKLSNGFTEVSYELLIQSLRVNLKRNDVVYEPEYLNASSCTFETRSQATLVSYCMCGPNWAVFPLGIDLYSGLSGLLIKEIIFSMCNPPSVSSFVDKLADTLFKKISCGVGGNNCSYLSGLSGALLALTLYNGRNSTYIYEMNLFHKKVMHNCESTGNLDFFDGLSGIVCCYHLIHKYDPSEENFRNAVFLCSALIQKVSCTQNDETGLSEPGIAHGLSGLCLALSICKNYVGNELHLFIDEKISTLLNKETDAYLLNSVPLFSTWCRGAAGMISVRQLLARDYRLDELNGLHASYEADMNGWCHGMHSEMILPVNPSLNPSVSRWSAPYRQFSLGLFTGEAGVLLSELYRRDSGGYSEKVKGLIRDLLLPC